MIGITNDFYNFLDDNLDFFIEHKDLTESQIAKAGYRLARLLNEFFDN